MNTFTYNSYSSDLRTIQDVLQQMTDVTQELQDTDLHNLQYFNHTYYIITKNVHAKFNVGYFSSDSQMEEFDIAFARYYFDALKAYTQHQSIAPAWQTCFDACKANSRAHTICMALGVNAHVNNDLALVLHDTNYGNPYKQEYDKINPVIVESLNEVLDYLHDPTITFKLLHILYPYYLLILTTLIVQWRKSAWQNYQKLIQGKTTQEKIITNAEKSARRLLLLTHLP